MDMKLEQEDRFRLLVQAQDEDRRAIRSLLGQEESPSQPPSIAHVPLMRMGPHDDPEAFVDLFEKTAEGAAGRAPSGRCAWFPCWRGKRRWPPTATCREPPGLWRPQGGHPPTGRPQPRAATTTLPLRRARGQRPTFMMAQQLRDACRKWLLAESRDVEGVIDQVVLEQFIVLTPRYAAAALTGSPRERGEGGE